MVVKGKVDAVAVLVEVVHKVVVVHKAEAVQIVAVTDHKVAADHKVAVVHMGVVGHKVVEDGVHKAQSLDTSLPHT